MSPMTQRDRVAGLIEALHDQVTAYFAGLDGGGEFREDRWDRPGGGGGVTRVMENGVSLEKAGINRSVVTGVLAPTELRRLGARAPEAESGFFAAGMSLVIHPRSPMVPTVHLNVRYFEISGPNGETLDAWFGGGTDLTPTYPFPDDARHFHVRSRRCATGTTPRSIPDSRPGATTIS